MQTSLICFLACLSCNELPDADRLALLGTAGQGISLSLTLSRTRLKRLILITKPQCVTVIQSQFEYNCQSTFNQHPQMEVFEVLL